MIHHPPAMRFLLTILLLQPLGWGAAHAAETRVLDEVLLGELRSEAARNHPAAAAGMKKAQAAEKEVEAVRLWNDPMLGFGLMVADSAMRADQGDLMVGLEQALPKPGMFEAQKSRARAMARAESENARVSALDAGLSATKAAVELALADESVRLQASQVEWMTAMVANAKQMAADPMGSGTEALRMEAELARDQQMLESARRNREGLARKLNLALGRSIDKTWPELRLPDDPPAAPSAESMIARVRTASPRVRSMREMAEAARAEKRMAEREKLPEVSVGVDVRGYSGGDLRSGTIGIKVSLPWFNDPIYKARIAASQTREEAATREADAMEREIETMVVAATTEARNAAAEARSLTGETLVKTRKALETTESAWISSKAKLTDLLDASRSLLALRLQERRMIAMELAALEELHSLGPAPKNP